MSFMLPHLHSGWAVDQAILRALAKSEACPEQWYMIFGNLYNQDLSKVEFERLQGSLGAMAAAFERVSSSCAGFVS